MPDLGQQGWQELQEPSRKQCPKLFYNLNTDGECLNLLMTDLISVWESSLDKYDIIGEAARQHTSIDPSVSSDQFDVLLTKIAKSLKDGENVLSKQVIRNSQVLILSTKLDLPKPLKRLEWTFKLTPQDASEMAERILRPSLHEVAVSQDKIKSLIRAIKDKDHIISRLLERIGSSSIDLSLVFPGITGMARRGAQVTVTDAKKHVPGMAPFDEKLWTKQFANDDGYEGADRTGLGNLVRGCEKCFAHSKAEHEGWVKELSSPTKKEVAGSKKTERPKSTASRDIRGESKSNDESTDSDDEFERQPTPPALRSRGGPTTKPLATPMPEPDEEDEGEERTANRGKLSKIGRLGRRNATKSFGHTESRSESPSPDRTNGSSPPRRGSDSSTSTATATEDEDEEVKPLSKARGSESTIGALRSKQPLRKSPSPSPSPTRHASKEKNHYRSPPSAQTDDSSELDLDASPSPAKPQPRQHHRLGRLGAKSATTSSGERDADTSSRGQSNLKNGNNSNDPSGSESDSQSKPGTQTTPRRRKLGRIGAHKQSTQAQPSSSPSASSAGPQSNSSRKTKGNKQTSEDNDNGSDNDSDATNSPSPSTTRLRSRDVAPRHSKDKDTSKVESEPPSHPHGKRDSPSPAKEETVEEKANRRRMELKRTIAANAGAKKKRRF
ncbi:hypothetical protein PV08_03349 [Exophiala spinifera]|uniref:Non-homologous end-joining factor 1 n=1 Tax=Exophiala spinifera TaxID=91928 RepID=A0A0D2C696_9EURO|nr:uncharacterized protein PV08_03349 [Exophiala spinifera]KIW19059.1 hypothetical protein PV08_03349 [Exophiala spinifera]